MTMTTTGGQSGTVTSSSGGLNCRNTATTPSIGTCTATFPAGTAVTLTATGGNFISFSGTPCGGIAGGPSPRTCTFTPTSGAVYDQLNVDFS